MAPRKERVDCFRLRSLSFGGQVVAADKCREEGSLK
jgi:hypothetical protein